MSLAATYSLPFFWNICTPQKLLPPWSIKCPASASLPPWIFATRKPPA
jgi:hypothetical protein